jgi:4-amino-4-deoxy-L-arabinose transferase-like glycosyltransferase
MYVAVGLGVMTKGPIALALPAIVFLAYLVATRRLATIRHLMLPTGAVIVAAIVIPYYFALYAQHGWESITHFLMRENLARYADGVGSPDRGRTYYLAVLFGDLYFPWSLILPAGLALVPWRRLWPGSTPSLVDVRVDTGVSHETVRLLLGLWIALIVAFFSFSRAQQDLYILPCVVAAAALVGVVVDLWLREALTPRTATAVTWSVRVAAIVLLVLGVALVFVVGGMADWMHLSGAVPIGVTLCIAAGVAIGALARRSAMTALAALGVGMVVAHWMLVLWALPEFERYKPVPHLARAIERMAPAGARVGMHKGSPPSLVYYLRRHIEQPYTAEDLTAFFMRPGPGYCVMTEEEYGRLQTAIGVPTAIVAASPRFDAQLDDFLSRRPMRNLVVATQK